MKYAAYIYKPGSKPNAWRAGYYRTLIRAKQAALRAACDGYTPLVITNNIALTWTLQAWQYEQGKGWRKSPETPSMAAAAIALSAAFCRAQKEKTKR